MIFKQASLIIVVSPGLGRLHYTLHKVFLKVHLQDSVDIVIKKKALIDIVFLATLYN